MKWVIIGADEETGAELELKVEAEDQSGALREAKKRRIFVSDLRPVAPPTAAAEPHIIKSWWSRQPLRVRYLLTGVALVFLPLFARGVFAGNATLGVLAAGGALIGLGLVVCWIVMALVAVAAKGLKDDR